MAHIQKRCHDCGRSIAPKARICPSCGGREIVYRARYAGPDRRERSRTFDRRIDAERYLATQEADKARGAWLDPALGQIRLHDWAGKWMPTQVARKPKTAAGYASILRQHIEPAFGSWPLVEIQQEDVAQFVAELSAATLAPNTVRNIYRVLSGLMHAAVTARRIAASPCMGIAVPRAPKRHMIVLSPTQVTTLAEAAEPHSTLILFASYTGLRWGEIAALRVGRLDLLRRVVHVVESASEVGGQVLIVTPKTGHTRTVSLPGFLSDALMPLVNGKGPGDLVFTSPDGGPMRHTWFYAKVFRPAATAAGMGEMLRFHDLRHTCASLLIAQGAHPRAIMERLGHSTITTTMDVYGHLLPSLDEALTAGLEAAHREARDRQTASGRPEGGEVLALPR